jgi:hypothetical protein
MQNLKFTSRLEFVISLEVYVQPVVQGITSA